MSTNRNDGDGNGQNDERQAAATDVIIPGENVVIDHWVVSSGSFVRKGEMIAHVCKRSDNNTNNNPAAVVAPKHKRPSRRKKTQKLTVAVAVAEKSENKSQQTSNESSSLSATKSKGMSLKELLAAKNNRKPEVPTRTKSENNESGSTPPEKKTVAPSTSTTTPPPTTTATKAKETLPIHAPATGILRILNSLRENKSQLKLIVAVIEECLHPTFLDGMCVICGARGVLKNQDNNFQTEANKNNAGKTSQVTVSGGVTMIVSQRESENMALLDSRRLFGQKRLSLVLDLDHTLVHATSDGRAIKYVTSDPEAQHYGDVRTISLPIFEGADSATKKGMDPRHVHLRSQHYVKLRPYVKEFLEGVQDMYEVSVYTAGTRQYAEEIAMVLCRKLAGASMDSDELERLRYNVKIAEEEFSQNLKAENKRTIDEVPATSESNGTENAGEESNTEPPKKKKKVSFQISEAVEDKGGAEKYERMTKEKLEHMRLGLRSAEELELKAKDLRQRVFGSRIVSRTDVGDLGRDVKSLKRIFPCGGTMTAVVDDREDVWANAKDNSDSTIKGEPPDNLLLVRPYHWKPFVGFADINNAAGADLSGSAPTNSDEQLLWTKNILENLHRRYYHQSSEGNRKTVPQTLREMRREVLMGSNMVLSGLVPLHKQVIGAGSARPHFVRYAQNLGAKTQDAVDHTVTHVVAAKDGTDKALAARKIPGCRLVKSAWLMECFWSMTRRNPTPFLLHTVTPGVAKNSIQPVQKVLRESNVDNSSEGSNTDSDDDDFVADFENELIGMY